jgi:hypothetical protein
MAAAKPKQIKKQSKLKRLGAKQYIKANLNCCL